MWARAAEVGPRRARREGHGRHTLALCVACTGVALPPRVCVEHSVALSEAEKIMDADPDGDTSAESDGAWLTVTL